MPASLVVQDPHVRPPEPSITCLEKLRLLHIREHLIALYLVASRSENRTKVEILNTPEARDDLRS